MPDDRELTDLIDAVKHAIAQRLMGTALSHDNKDWGLGEATCSQVQLLRQNLVIDATAAIRKWASDRPRSPSHERCNLRRPDRCGA